MIVIQISVDTVMTDNHKYEDITSKHDPSELELQQHCMTEWYEGYCEKCPYNDACNKYIMKHGTTPMDTFGE